jgi:hypothetical protein
MKIASFDIGEKNFAYCLGRRNENNIEISKVCHHDVVEKKRQTITESCLAISNILLQDSDLLDSDVVLIEQQMRSNVRAQRLSQHVWTFFHMMNKLNDNKIEIVYVPSHLKTQKFIGKNSMSGKQRKSWAIDKILGDSPILENHESIKLAIREMKKQDDVCDTILQMIAYELK